MPSSLSGSGSKARSIRNQGGDALRGANYSEVPDFTVEASFAAAQLTGANSGFFVWVAPAPCHFLGADVLWATAGTNTFRVKKVLAAATSAAGAAADANNVDLTAATALTTAANTNVEVAPVTTDAAHVLELGDKVAIASAAGTATLAGALAVLRFAYI
jgi:hypothetical protein